LKSKPKEKQHHAAMPMNELPGFMQQLQRRDSVSAVAVEFTILTAARTSEVLGACWDEVDLEAGVWTVPAARMKSGRQHRVPLSDRALNILKNLGNFPHDQGFIFPGQKEGKPLSNMAMLELLKGTAGNGYTTHGFRSTFSDWARDRTAYSRDVIEMALAHTIKDKSEAAYRRGDALDKRRRLMTEWAKFCEAPAIAANVVPIRA
jgi:integrase